MLLFTDDIALKSPVTVSIYLKWGGGQGDRGTGGTEWEASVLPTFFKIFFCGDVSLFFGQHLLKHCRISADSINTGMI